MNKKWGSSFLVVGLVLFLLGVVSGIGQLRNGDEVDLDSLQFKHPPIPKVNSKLDINSQAFIVIDVSTNTILAERNKDLRTYPASITKLVTALTALNVYPLEEKLKVTSYNNGKIMELVESDEMTVRDLVKAIIIHSANDAAFNLANQHTKGVGGFIDEMNKLVAKYGLTNSHFTNFDGLHQNNHYSSAYDLAQIGRLAIKNKTIKDNSKLITSEVTGSMGLAYKLQTTNELLGKTAEIKGLKTGWTPEAGGCFLALIEIDNKQVISVILNSNDRFGDTQKMVEWLKNEVSWIDY